MIVGSVSKRIGRRRRLMNTPATIGRSAATPVSRSTMEARLTSSSGVRERQVGRAARPNLGDSFIVRVAHLLQQRRARHAALRHDTCPAGSSLPAALRHIAGQHIAFLDDRITPRW
jgi:hypothetical protein